MSPNAGQGQVCSNQLSQRGGRTSSRALGLNGAPVGVSYVPPGMNVTRRARRHLIFDADFLHFQLGAAADGLGTFFRIDAVGYGGSPDAIAIIESTSKWAPERQDLNLAMNKHQSALLGAVRTFLPAMVAGQ